MLTPNDIEVILHCHTSPAKHPRYDAPAVREAHETFLQLGMIRPAEGYEGFITTEKGNKFVKMLCATPYPVTKYIDPRNER